MGKIHLIVGLEAKMGVKDRSGEERATKSYEVISGFSSKGKIVFRKGRRHCF